MHRLFLAGEVHGTTHLYAGQEAVAVGTCLALEPDDYVAGTYRGHGHALAKGTPPGPLVAEMLGRASGICGGRAGSMNVIDLEHGLIGCYGIVGGSIAAALGAALSAQRQGRVSVAFFGDGAANQGYFHECLNMAKVFALPAVFVCENNFYGEFTPMAAVTAGADIAGPRAGIRDAVCRRRRQRPVGRVRCRAGRRLASARRRRARRCSSARPTATTATPRAIRRRIAPRRRSSSWLARDPIKLARARLLEEGVRGGSDRGG